MTLSKNAKIEISKRNKTVYKKLSVYSSCLYSPFQGAQYKLQELTKVRSFGGGWGTRNFVKKIPNNAITVHEGIHAYTTIEEAKLHWKWCHIVKCIIPAGTPFIVNTETNEIVSLALKPVKVIE
jgi:hypothetical protein